MSALGRASDIRCLQLRAERMPYIHTPDLECGIKLRRSCMRCRAWNEIPRDEKTRTRCLLLHLAYNTPTNWTTQQRWQRKQQQLYYYHHHCYD